MTMESQFPRLSDRHSEINKLYDVIVIGSGYGASIAASRCVRAGQKVCVLERGKEWLPGDFPETLREASSHMQVTSQGKKGVVGDPTDLYEFITGNDITVLQGCGLGGGSLINANVALDADPKVFENPVWPKELKADLKNLNDVDRKHFYDMMKPNPYPESYPSLPKTEAMRRAAEGLGLVDVEDLDKLHKKLDLYVNFDGSKPNQLGIHQPACNNCGNCCGGCNTGAKNTLNMNYLPDAKAHGAQIFTEVEVAAVTRDPYASIWRVHYKRNISVGGFKEHEQLVRAKYVILGAGALGSTKILLKSKQRGLDVSEKLGKQFTGNGDVLGFCYHAKDEMDAIGLDTGIYDKVHPSAPGPAITSAIDLRSLPDKGVTEGIVIEDGTPPGSTKIPYSITMAFASKVLGVRKFPSKKKMERVFEKLKGDDMDKTLAFLCMTHDDAGGEISLEPKTDGVCIKWDKVGRQQNFATVNEHLKEITAKLDGTFVINPLWSKKMGRELITAHPLGGCPMGEDGSLGVVNHKGQVFDGDSVDVHPGLYVMDGSIIPCSVGANPTLTISILAERCARLLIQDAGWKIDYERFKLLDKEEFQEEKPGIRFTERMVGDLTFQSDFKKARCDFILTIESEDVEEMIEKDPKHRASIAGTVTCKRLSDEPMTVSSGEFQLFSESVDIVDAKEMVYDMALSSVEGDNYYFYGRKIIKDDEFAETGLEDTTTLFTKIYKGENSQGPLLAEGVLKMKFFDFMKQLKTIEIIGTDSSMEKIKWRTKFSNFFSKELWDTYSGFSDARKFDPDAPPREKRDLTVKIVPEIYKCVTEDKVELKLTRYRGGGKGPLMVWHGMGVSSNYFTLDTIDVNMIEYFCGQNYDVWIVDWRSSNRLVAAAALQYNIDDVAMHDFPTAVVKVLELTGQKTVQMLVHCVSSLACFASLFAGKLVGKIRQVVASQVAATPKGCFSNNFKSKAHLTGFLSEGLGIKHVTTYTDKNSKFKGKAFNWVAKTTANLTTAQDERCSSDICHRITFFYGLLWEHENLNVSTHDIVHELFGSGTAGFFNHVSKVMRKNRLVGADGKDIYMPGANKKNRMEREDFRRHIEHLNIPICLFGGEKNNCFDPKNLRTFHDMLKEAHPNQDYELFYIPGYGHLDVYIGKNAHRDVWPKLISVFDKYAEDDVAKDKGVRARVQKALNKVKIVSRQGRRRLSVCDQPYNLPLLKPEKEITLTSRRPADDTDDDDDEEEDGAEPSQQNFVNRKLTREISMADALPEHVHEKRIHLETMLPDEQTQVWHRKHASKSTFHKEPPYTPPESDGIEDVVVQRFTIPEESCRREIYVMSDLHMGGEWSKEIRPRLEDFLKTLAKIADHYVHSIILLGDIFEMWMTPITVTPPTLKEFVKHWRSDDAVQVLVSCIRKMAEEDGVNVYYVRGNHDYEIDEETVKVLFGEKVHFVGGKLIYIVNNGVQEYRIRFEHGHDYDLFNCASVVPPDVESPLCGHPFGYYVTRCCASSNESYFSDTEEILQNILRWFLDTLPADVVGSTIVEILGSRKFQRKLCETMLEQAFDKDLTGEECILLGDDKWVRVREIFNFKFIKEAISRYGSSRVFSMLKASLGDFKDFLAEFGEDVVVIGHTHFCCNENLTGRAGNLYYANSGTWIDLAEHFSYVKVIPPKASADGSLEVNYKINEASSQRHTHKSPRKH